jgi:hypothetical protein
LQLEEKDQEENKEAAADKAAAYLDDALSEK